VEQKQLEFLKSLVETPGVSGYEEAVQQVVRQYAKSFCDSMTTDLHGNLILCKNPDAPVRVMLAGHADQIGLIVSHISDDGFIYTQTVGGWDPQQLIGQRMTIWSETGPVHGVIARKPIHLLDDVERKKVVKTNDLWIDIGARSKEDTKNIRIGDQVTFHNRTGVWVVVETLRRCAEAGIECGLYAVATVQEEIGLRGAKTAAHAVDPHIGIAVDVTHATDCPTIDKNQNGDIRLGGGPVILRGPNPNINPEVNARLNSIAQANNLPIQHKALGRAAPNDSNALQVTRGGVAAGILAIPNRYMHSAVETVELSDLDNAATLLAKFVQSVTDQSDFIPNV